MARGRKPIEATGTGCDAPAAPDTLSPDAVGEWDRVMPLLVAGGVVQRVDQAILAAYCETVVLWRRLTRLVGEVEIDGPRKPPCYVMWLETSKQLRGLCDQLAFTPAARKQVIKATTTRDPLKEALGDL